MDHGSLVERLDRMRDRVVPVIGAGLAIGCGAPSSSELADKLVEAAGVEMTAGNDLYEVANELERIQGTTWVQEQVAEITLAAELRPTSVMLAVTLINRRLVATTNYDDAVEEAARRHGLTPKSLVPTDLPMVLEGPGSGELFVLHLHGTAHRPNSIVLTQRTYENAEVDEALQSAVRTVAAGNALVFLGHRLAENEVHLRRDVKRATELFGGSEHLLIYAEGDLPEPMVLETETGVYTAAYPNPHGDYRLLQSIARRLGVPPLSTPHSLVQRLTIPLEPAYEPMPIAPASEVETEEQRQVWGYGWLIRREDPPTVDDVTSSALLLVGRPGTGKTQALLHTAQRSKCAVYVRLGAVAAPITGQDPGDVLVGWVHRAGGTFHEVPAVTRVSLQDYAYDFLLDGLDELRASHRRDVIEVAGAMAASMPQHRWVLASRRVPELTTDSLVDFDRYELAPSHQWLARFAKQHGVESAELDEQVAAFPALTDLLDVPLFASAVLELIKNGEQIPASPLELLLSFASRGLSNEETRLGAAPAAVDAWLDRLALAMLCASTDSASDQAVTSRSLLRDLSGEIAREQVVDRVLLVESEGGLRFPIRPIRDARATRELCRLPNGTNIFNQCGVVRVAGQEHLRPDWQYAADLLAGVSEDWRTFIGRTDPLTAARATTAAQGHEEQLSAAQTILEWYRSHHIHIPRTSDGQVRDDDDALRLLAADARLDALLPDLTQDLGDPDPARRGNAVVILSLLGAVNTLRPRVSTLLRDEDSVVRRRTAAMIVDQAFSSFASVLVDLAMNDPDDFSRRTLAEAAIRVADDSEAGELVTRLSPRLRREVLLAIDDRLTRAEQLVVVASIGEVDRHWLVHLATQEPHTWDAADVQELARLWQIAEPYQLDPDVRQVMTQHPADALRGAFRAGLDRASMFGVLPLLEAADTDSLDRLSQEAGPDAQGLIRDYRSYTSRTDGQSRPMPPDPPRFDLTTAIAAGNLASILDNRPSAEAIESLTSSTRNDLESLVDRAWGDPASGTSPMLRITRPAPRHWNADPGDFELAHLALRIGRAFTQEEWFRAVQLTPHEPQQQANLREAFDRTWDDRAIDELPAMDEDVVESLIRALPDPWTNGLAEAVADRAFGAMNDDVHQVAAERIAENGHLNILTTLASGGSRASAIYRVLAVTGDAEAERWLLDDFERRDYPALGHWGGDSVWIDKLAKPSSAEGIGTSLRAMLRRGVEAHELAPLFRALNRCAGDDAALAYDAMISDESIPSAPFLWYRKQELIASQPPEIETVELVTQAIYGDSE